VQWQWCIERFGQAHDPLLYRREILTDPGLAAGWVLWFMAKSHFKIWEGARDRDPHFMEEVWKMFRGLTGEPSWNGQILHWKEDSSRSYLSTITSKNWWGLGATSNARIESLLPEPGIDWRLTIRKKTPRPAQLTMD
jgi:hypothetical protein